MAQTLQETLKGTQDLLTRIKTEGVTNAAGEQQAFSAEGLNKALTAAQLPTVDPDTFDYRGTVAAGNAMINPPATSESSMEGLFKQYLGEQKAPESQADLYEQELSKSGVTESQKKLNELQAQLGGMTAETQAKQLAMREQGISAGAIQGRNVAEERQLAIRALPLQAQIAAEQGNLKIAQDRLNTVFQLKSQDAQNQYNYKSKLIDSVYEFATKQEQERLDEKKIANQQAFQLSSQNRNDANQWAIKALESGDSELMGEINALDANSPTFQTDLAKLTARIQIPLEGNTLDDQMKMLQIQKLQKELSGGGGSGINETPENIIAYAQQYASTGLIPTGLPKGTFGLVSQVAKDLPKVDGTIVDNNTGIKSSKLSSAQADGFASLKDLTIKIDQAKELFDKIHTGFLSGLWGSAFPSTERQQYNTLRSEIVDLLARARSGAALTVDEVAEYSKKLPSNFNKSFWVGQSGDTLLSGLKSSIDGKLDTGLKSQGLSMYGFSSINIGDKVFKVGDIIDVNGSQGRINPDGTITPIN